MESVGVVLQKRSCPSTWLRTGFDKLSTNDPVTLSLSKGDQVTTDKRSL